MDKFIKKHLKKIVKKHCAKKVDRLVYRQRVAKHIASVAIDGKIQVVESGRDCDGVKYWGHARVIPASVMAFEALDNYTREWADGPYHLDIVSPTVVVESGERDLVLEAFENGHPHVIFD